MQQIPRQPGPQTEEILVQIKNKTQSRILLKMHFTQETYKFLKMGKYTNKMKLEVTILKLQSEHTLEQGSSSGGH